MFRPPTYGGSMSVRLITRCNIGSEQGASRAGSFPVVEFSLAERSTEAYYGDEITQCRNSPYPAYDPTPKTFHSCVSLVAFARTDRTAPCLRGHCGRDNAGRAENRRIQCIHTSRSSFTCENAPDRTADKSRTRSELRGLDCYLRTFPTLVRGNKLAASLGSSSL